MHRRSLILAGLALAAAEHPEAPGAWTQHTSLVERVRRGSKTLVVSDCRGIQAGGRVRLSVGRSEEEEGSISSLSCPSPGAARVPTVAVKQDAPCDLAALGWVSPDGLDGSAADAATPLGGAGARETLPAHCQKLLATAARVPGLAESYQSRAKRSSHKLSGGAPMQPEDSPAAATRETVPIPGVLTLAAATLFEHAPKAAVRTSSTLAAAAAAPSCPTDADAVACSGRGTCREDESCLCHTGYEGHACERAVAVKVVAKAEICAAGCNSHGNCLAGKCACHVGWHGERCHQHTAAACESSCGGPSHGTCALATTGGDPICLCKHRFVGATCLTVTAQSECAASCGAGGKCVGGACSCYKGYSGTSCEHVCSKNCTETTTNGIVSHQGRCSASGACVCKEGYSGPACEQMCPSRCTGHGECQDGECQCRDGYSGIDCSEVDAQDPAEILLGAFEGYYPLMLIVLIALMAFFVFCCCGYIVNRWRGRFGTAAVPMWEYFAKSWRNAPLFEPIFAVSATTQTSPPPKSGGSGRASFP